MILLLERDAALATLHRLREEAATNGGRLVFVEGEAGIGKTSLLGAFRASLPDGVTALLGTCDPLSTPRPLGPIVDVAAELDPALARSLADGAPRDAILPALLGSIRARGPGVVLLLDDLHWADEATLDALRFVGRRIETTRALVVAAYRDDEVGPEHPLRVVIGDLATSAAVRRLPLAAFSAASVQELAEGTGLDPVEVHRQTGGNPFFVTEIIAGAPSSLPPTVRDAVLARVARLSSAARRTVEAAAVIGPTLEPGVLIRVVEPVAADECLASGLLVARDGRYAFRHELARQAILGATDPTVRIRLHARVLAALEAEPGEAASLAVLAHHADGAGDGAAVLRYAPAAARQAAAAGANREAAAHLGRAVRAAGRLADAERAELLRAYGDAQAAIGGAGVAVSAYAEEVAIWHRLGARIREGHAMCGLADAYIGVGRNEDAETVSREAIALTSAEPQGPEYARALMTQAYLRMLDRDNQDAVALGRQVLAVDPEALAPATRASAWNLVGSARILLDDPAGRDDLLTGLRIFEQAGIAWGVRSCYGNLGSAFGEMYRFADAEPYLVAGIRYAEDHDVDPSYLGAWRAVIDLHRGAWTAAEARAGSIARDRHVFAIARVTALYALGRVKARRGDADAGDVLDEALAVAAPTGTLQRIAPVRAARAEAAWLAGDLARSADEAGSAVELARAKRHPWHIGELSWWLLKAGQPPGDTSHAAEPWRLQFRGRWREAAAAWDARECPYESARALLESDDVSDVERAHGIFDRLGAAPTAALAQRRLRDLGAHRIPRGRRAAARANSAGLTARELEVLRLIATGIANGEIAARLYVSQRTVDHHVAAVLAKLGVGSRRQAGDAAAALGIELSGDDATQDG